MFAAKREPGGAHGHARKEVIPSASHAANIDRSEASNAAVLGFLEGLSVK